MDGPYSMHRSGTVIQWRICLQSKMTIWQKGVQPPKYWQKEGQIFSPTATSVFFVKSTPNQNRQRLPCSLGSSQPSVFCSFFFECIADERVIRSGVWLSTPLGMLARGYTPPSLLSLGRTPSWHDFTPFWHLAIWCAPNSLKNTTGWRRFQLVVVVARRKDYVRRQTDQRPRPAQTWSA